MNYIMKIRDHHVFTFGIDWYRMHELDALRWKEKDVMPRHEMCISMSVLSISVSLTFEIRQVYWRNLERWRFRCPIGESNPCFSLESDGTPPVGRPLAPKNGVHWRKDG
jgi:hypothetical protein